MKIVIDEDLCSGHTDCVQVAPELFDMRDDGIAEVLIAEPGEEHREAAETAVRWCPAGAITIED